MTADRTVGCCDAANDTRIVPAPCPVVVPSVAHEASVLAVQVQSRDASTLTEAAPPSAPMLRVSAASDTWHLSGSGPVSSVTLVWPHPQARSTQQTMVIAAEAR